MRSTASRYRSRYRNCRPRGDAALAATLRLHGSDISGYIPQGNVSSVTDFEILGPEEDHLAAVATALKVSRGLLLNAATAIIPGQGASFRPGVSG